ncbi:MAG: hypothetical protein AB7E13_01360 [Arcobacteraceae bacterium]
MKSLIFLSLAVLIFVGCSNKIERPYIDNYSICSQTISNVIIDHVSIENQNTNLYVTKDEIKTTFEESLKQSGCFYIYNTKNDSQLLDGNTYILNLKASVYQEQETTKKNLIKKDDKEKLIMVFNVTAHNGEKSIMVSSKSGLLTNSTKVLGFETTKEYQKDKSTLIESASKQAVIALQEQIK